MRTIAGCGVALLLTAVSARAQVRDARPAPAPTGTAVIRGRVVAGDSGRPLRRVAIAVATPQPGPAQGRTSSTDEDGRYEVTDLAAGRYTVTATRAGFLQLRYGQRRPREIGKVIDVADGQTVEHIDFALPKMSVISGRVTDEDGEPIAGVTVMAMRSMYFRGRRQLLNATEPMLRTDDAGEYRLGGLVPGTYVIVARSRDEWTASVDGRDQTMGYTPTYFPGTSNLADATRVTVGIGEEAAATDFSLRPGRAVTVSGTAVDSRGKPFPGVNLKLEVRSERGGFFGSAGNVRTSPDGRFVFRNVAPGDYILGASRQDPDPEVVSLPIVVDGQDLTDLVLTGSAGGTVSGRVTLDGGVSAKMPSVRISITERWLGQPDPSMLGAFRNRYLPVTPGEDGAFTVSHVFGPAYADVTLPEGWIVKSLVHKGRDITDLPIELRNGEELSGLEMTITNRVTSVAGTLTDSKGSPLADGTIIVFAADTRAWFDGSRFVRATRPDQQGTYQIRGLPAGDYLALALDYVEDGAWNEPSYLESLRTRAQPLTLRVDEPRTLALVIALQP